MFCRYVKVMRENVFLNICYEKKECFSDKYNKSVIQYNFVKDKIDIEMKNKYLKNILKI